MAPIAFVLLLLAWLAAGCGGSRIGPTPLAITVTMIQGQSVTVRDAGLALRFDSVPEDSRCPLDAICVSAGRAVARLTATLSGAEKRVEIRSDPPSARVASLGEVRLEWEQLQPYPWASRPTPPGPYELTVKVTR